LSCIGFKEPESNLQGQHDYSILENSIGLLYAPLSGTETKRPVKEKALEIKEKAEKAVTSR
jgi:hypothetical protein